MLIYLDANIVIYAVQNVPVFGPKAQSRLTSAIANGDTFAISDLTRLECRCHPLARGATTVLANYDSFFLTPEVQKVPLTTAVYD